MKTSRAVLVVGIAVAALALAGCGGSSDSAGTTSTTTTTPTTSTPAGHSGKKLDGSVGPGFVISLMQNGQAVTTLAAGTYALTVNDQSDAHNFHLTGPAVDVSTTVEEVGTKTFKVTLQDGSYHFQCDPHSSVMNGDFTVSG